MKSHHVGVALASLVLAIGADPLGALLGGSGSMACTSTHPIQEGVTVEPKHWGVSLGIRVTSEGGTFTAKNVSGMTLSGCLRFLDSEGNQVGEATDVSLEDGECLSGEVPEGATDFEVSDEPCGDDDQVEPVETEPVQVGGNSFPSPPGQQQATPIGPRPVKSKYTFTSAPIGIDPYADTQTFAITVHTSVKADALAIRDFLREFGITRALPSIDSVSHVEVHYYAESHVDYADMEVEFAWATDDAFTGLTLDLNGVPSFSLADTHAVVAPNGWDALELAVPFSHAALNYDPLPGAQWRNDYDVRVSTDEANEYAPTEHSGWLTFESD